MAKPLKIDILQMELDQKLPNWLSPVYKQSEHVKERIRTKHRQRYLAQHAAERAKKEEEKNWQDYFAKFNPYHEPGGTPEGGEFASGPGAFTGERIMQEIPQGKPNSILVPNVAQMLNDRAGDKLEKRFGVRSITEDNHTPEMDEFLAEAIVRDLKSGLKNGHASPTWYSDKMKETMMIAQQLHPEIATDPNKRFAFIVSLAITSQGALVDRSAQLTEEAYEQFNRTGKFPEKLKVHVKSINANFKKLNTLIAENDGKVDNVREFFDAEMTAKELQDRTGYEVKDVFKTDLMNGSAYLGPKIGMGFYQNLNGNFKPLTMDRWFMRAWGRMTNTGIQFSEETMQKNVDRLRDRLKEAGKAAPLDREKLHQIALKLITQHERDWRKSRRPKTPLEYAAERYDYNYGGHMQEDPKNATQRAWMTEVFNKAREKLKAEGVDLEPAAAQATWWNPEQALYKHLGGKVRDVDDNYAKAFARIAAGQVPDDQETEEEGEA